MLLTLMSHVCLQPVQLSAELEGLLLSMCEDVMVRRTDLLTVLEACELHYKASLLPPPERLIRQLVEDVYRNSVSGTRSGLWTQFWFQFSFLKFSLSSSDSGFILVLRSQSSTDVGG